MHKYSESTNLIFPKVLRLYDGHILSLISETYNLQLDIIKLAKRQLDNSQFTDKHGFEGQIATKLWNDQQM